MSKLAKYPSLSHLSGIVKALNVGGGSHGNRDLERREEGKKAGFVLSHCSASSSLPKAATDDGVGWRHI